MYIYNQIFVLILDLELHQQSGKIIHTANVTSESKTAGVA